MSGDIFELDQGDRETLRGTLHDPKATTGDVLTVQADKSIAAKPGGGAGGVQVVTVPVSSAQILDLFNTPVVLIPGTPGNVTVVNSAMLAYIAGLVPYLDGGGNIDVQTTPSLNWLQMTGAGFWDQATDKIFPQGYSSTPASSLPTATYAGADVVLLVDTANPTLGDGTLLVSLSYFLAPTV